jgi:Fic family protein
MAFEPKYTVTPRIQRQLVAIERTRGFLDAVRLDDDWLAEVRHTVRIRDALSSLQIEGNSLTFETAFALARERPERALRDSEKEFLNYLTAFDTIDGLRGERDYPLRPSDLRGIHRMLVDGVRGGERYAGHFRRESVAVGDVGDEGTIIHHQPPEWHEVESHLEDLLEWVEGAKRKPTKAQMAKGVVDTWTHPVLVAGILQHRLVWTHPFLDGNGRSARMFTAMLMYQRGYDFKYLFDLSSYYNYDRDKYYEALRTADATEDYTAWLEYFIGGFSRQMMAVKSKAVKAFKSVHDDS